MVQITRLILPALLLAGCSKGGAAPGPVTLAAPKTTDWRGVATPEDRKRLREWRVAFVDALDQARASGHEAALQSEGALVDPDAGVRGSLPPGRYTCRIVKLGTAQAGTAAYRHYPTYPCAVTSEGELSSFAQLSGAQRPTGLIFNGQNGRQIFLGTLMLGDETRALDSGRDSERDMAGAIERIGAERWRLVLPYPRFESMLDLVEITPAAPPFRPAATKGGE